MSSTTKEVVTLQIGHYANFVGTHWWNIQESGFVYSPAELSGPKEVNHDVMFREGTNLAGDVTYTPRLIAFDLKGSLNTLRQEGVLYDIPEQEEDLRWRPDKIRALCFSSLRGPLHIVDLTASDPFLACLYNTWWDYVSPLYYRNNDVTMHKSDSGHKNEFLRDLDREEARYLGTQDQSGENDMDANEESDTDVLANAPPIQPTVFGPKYYDLDSTLHVWSDFLRPHLHPRSVHVLNQYQHNDTDSFNVFGYGQQIFQNHMEFSEIEDRLHFFLEECDYLQGLHMLADSYDGFGGLSSSLLEHLSDEYPSKCLLVFPLSPPVFNNTGPRQDCYRLLTSALSYSSMLQHSSLMLPLSTATSLWSKPGAPISLPNCSYQSDLAYHTSAILASSLDTMSMPYRLENNASHMTHLSQALTPAGRKVCTLFASHPFPYIHGSTLNTCLQELEKSLTWQPLTPVGPAKADPIAQSAVLRGVPCRRTVGSSVSSGTTADEELLQAFLRNIYPNTVNASCIVRHPCKVSAPYPHIFSSSIGSDGYLSHKERPNKLGVESVPVLTGLQCSPLAGSLLLDLHSHATKLDIKKFHQFMESGMEEDEYSEALNNLLTCAQVYNNGTSNTL